jgi:hypothetical protein
MSLPPHYKVSGYVLPEALQGGLANIHGAGNVVLYKDTGVCRVDNFLTREGRCLAAVGV